MAWNANAGAGGSGAAGSCSGEISPADHTDFGRQLKRFRVRWLRQRYGSAIERGDLGTADRMRGLLNQALNGLRP